jgi:outer membrane biosynthesis protein TonB
VTAVAHRVFGSGPADSEAARRFIGWSLGVHLAIVALLVIVPRSWFSTKTERPTVMTITLAGTVGPRTTGMTAMGGRTVEQVAPPQKRPEPERPAPRPDAPVAAIRTTPPPRQVPQPAAAEIRSTAPSRVPTTGSQVTTGSTAVDTGARSQSLGLTQGGGGTGGDADLVNFCCPESRMSAVLSTRPHSISP